MAVKSIALSPIYITVIVLWYFSSKILTTIVLAKGLFHEDDFYFERLNVTTDLPIKGDMESYLASLEGIAYFAVTYKRYVDLNFCLGLFLANVNLRTIIKIKGERFPGNLETRFQKLLEQNDEAIKYFRHMMYVKLAGSDDSPVINVTQLFSDERPWTSRLQIFKTDLLKKTTFYSKEDMEEIYDSKWSSYEEKIDNRNAFPTPSLSDRCIFAMSENPVNYKTNSWGYCEVSYSCHRALHHGTDYGYAITHRLLLLLLAKFSLGCVIDDISHDRKVRDKFCAKIYNEAQFIVMRDYSYPDLLMEEITLCALEGHAQFVRKSWLEGILMYQTDLGCFGLDRNFKSPKRSESKIYSEERPNNIDDWAVTHEDQNILEGLCNSHITGLASASLAAGARFAMERYY